MGIAGVIFDSDGTLVDSESLSARVLSDILREAGAPLSAEAVLERFRGCRFAAFAQSILAEYPVMGMDELTLAFRERGAELYARELKPMNGAVELVSSLAIEKCVASNGPRFKIEQCLELTGLLPYFTNRIASAYEVQSWKPAPGLILHAAAMMGVAPERCLLVEDSLAGVQAGLAAGVQVVGYRLAADAVRMLDRQVPVIQELADINQFIQAS
ncbi:HAD-IA family hydrolase [Oxalobacteraceae bacterium A2-2]